jgi:branched-chain amino acid transport system substrate-binding protein
MLPMGTSRIAIGAVLLALGLNCATARADITIAAVGPMKGPFEVFGEQMKRGAERAVADLNGKGGVLGQKIKLVIADDACDPKEAVTVAKSMLNQGIIFVAGHFCSAASIAASDIYNAEGVLQITPASTNPNLTNRGFKNVYRVCGRDDQQGIIAGNYLADNFGGKKVAIAHDKQSYSKELAEAAKAQLNQRGINEALYETIGVGKKDYSAFVAMLKRNRIDVLYYGGYHREAALIVTEMRKKHMKTILVAGDDLMTKKYWAISGAAGEGTLMTYPRDPSAMEHAKSVVKAISKKGVGNLHAIYTYAAIQVWAQAAGKAGSLDLKKIIKALGSNTFKTAVGDITFDAKGDIKEPAYAWYKWSKGDFIAQ